ncbi:MAG: hypothetical protein ACYDAN_03215 [Candidatus Limnocylindrales bacterium]
MRVRRAIATGALGVALLLGGCGAQDASLVPVPIPSTPTPAPPAASSTPQPTLPMPSGAAVTLDPALMAILPTSVGGTPVNQEPESFGEAVKDPSFVASIDRAVFPIAVSGGDLASGVIAHVRPGVYSDKMFADWRSSYDEGACAQSSGVLAHAQETVAGRTTYVTTCGGDLRVYHTYVASQGVIVSLLSTGLQDFGAKLIGGIAG